jgi:chaperonin GroES
MIDEIVLLPTKILVKPEEIVEEKTSSGIIIPKTRKSSSISGVVRRAGVGNEAVPVPTKTGDTVFFFERSAQPVIVDDIDYLLLDIRDVLYWLPGKL